jgi:hypothetical protein
MSTSGPGRGDGTGGGASLSSEQFSFAALRQETGQLGAVQYVAVAREYDELALPDD